MQWLMMRVPAGKLRQGRPYPAIGEDHLSPDEFADHIGVSPTYVRREIELGELPGAGRMIRTRIADGEATVVNIDLWIGAALASVHRDIRDSQHSEPRTPRAPRR